MVADRQTHALPATEAAFAALATFMGFATPCSFAETLLSHLLAVQPLYDSFLRGRRRCRQPGGRRFRRSAARGHRRAPDRSRLHRSPARRRDHPALDGGPAARATVRAGAGSARYSAAAHSGGDRCPAAARPDLRALRPFHVSSAGRHPAAVAVPAQPGAHRPHRCSAGRGTRPVGSPRRPSRRAGGAARLRGGAR